ncbi:MAG TPA: hypothetical protein VGN88_10495 [Phycisphaerae bacterium]
MPVILDKKRQAVPVELTQESTVGDYLKWIGTMVPEGRVLVRIQVDGAILEGRALTEVRGREMGESTLMLTTGDQKELSLTMLGKLAALIEWLTPQHREVASMLEQGNTQPALERLAGILSAWQEIQSAYGNLAKMLKLSLKELPVREVTGEAVLEEFCKHLGEIQSALTNKDFVLLSDILQYEMEGAIASWMGLLEATLGVVEPVGV